MKAVLLVIVVFGRIEEMLLLTQAAQAAGHGRKGKGQRMILKDNEGHVLKPVQKPPKGQTEVQFYANINQSVDHEDIMLRKHFPKFYGVQELRLIDGVNEKEMFLVLEDVTNGMVLPNVMDVKLGRQTWAPDASREKQAMEDTKYAGTKQPYGFSVLGIIQHSIKDSSLDHNPVNYDKTFGKHLNTEDVVKIPNIFFDVKRSGVTTALVRQFVKEMKVILRTFKRQQKYKLYASSLLLAYDVANVRKYLETNDEKFLADAIRMKVIDFAHVFPSEGQTDDNFVCGLENLVKVFEVLLS